MGVIKAPKKEPGEVGNVSVRGGWGRSVCASDLPPTKTTGVYKMNRDEEKFIRDMILALSVCCFIAAFLFCVQLWR